MISGKVRGEQNSPGHRSDNRKNLGHRQGGACGRDARLQLQPGLAVGRLETPELRSANASERGRGPRGEGKEKQRDYEDGDLDPVSGLQG
jgi:hypothetical protein